MKNLENKKIELFFYFLGYVYFINNHTFSTMTHYNEKYEPSREELEAYQEKQFEDYLRLNPVDEDGNFIYDALILNPYTEEQKTQLYNYAKEYNISIEEAIEYQTHCHYCGKYIENPLFDQKEHQYCNKRCWNACEDYWYPCHKDGDCRVCSIWQYHKDREEKRKREDEILKYNMVLFAVEAFKELEIYGQFYECIPDLIEYFA